MKALAIRASIGVLLILALGACADGSDSSNSAPVTFSYDEAGPYPVGNRTVGILNAADGRMLDVELWYPAQRSGAGQSIVDFAIDDLQREELSALVEQAPAECTRRDTAATMNAAAEDGPANFPLVIFSHCHECTRFSSFSLAERLASHGFVVAAPDHAMNTLFDSGALLSGEFLKVRARDVAAVLDELLVANSQALPADLQGRIDPTRVGVAGHSYGAVTTGRVLQDDDRFRAGLIIAAPVENPVIPGVSVASIAEPTLYMVAQEDNSIGELGNVLMRANFDAAASPSWKVEVADAGHWSFSDIAALVPAFAAGCGDGVRQTVPGETFTYLDNPLARDITATYGMRFFAAHLLGDAAALQTLGESTHPDIVAVQSK